MASLNTNTTPVPASEWSLLRYDEFVAQLQKFEKSSYEVTYAQYCKDHKDCLSFMATQNTPRIEMRHQIAHYACNFFAIGQTVQTLTANELAAHVKFLLGHPGRITFVCKFLGDFHICDDEEQQNKDAVEKISYPSCPLVVSCIAAAIRNCGVTLQDMHSKRNEARIIDACQVQLTIDHMQMAGKVVLPELIAERVDPSDPSSVEGMDFMYAPEIKGLVDMVKQVLEPIIEEIRKQAGGQAPKEGCDGPCVVGAVRALGVVQRRLLRRGHG